MQGTKPGAQEDPEYSLGEKTEAKKSAGLLKQAGTECYIC